MAELNIGCSGFNYPHWRGAFYPEGMPQRQWLSHYASVFASVELNVTFYRLPSASTFEKWRLETPPDFIFTLKGSRFITHVKRLRDPEEPLERFFAAALELREKLGAVLWQLPPGFRAENQRLERFLKLLDGYPVRNTLEFREESWLGDETVSLCREHNVPLCMADWPQFLVETPLTADFVYIRRHGRSGDYATEYSQGELVADAGRIRGYLEGGRDVFIYFNNDAMGYAPKNAWELKGMLESLRLR
jgi:uncharacterized protein YecE (DUF72 family)